MTIRQINYPYELDLIKANNWHDIGNHTHFIIRFHLYIEDYQAENTTYDGEILASFHTVDKAQIISAIEKEHSIVDVDETICSTAISQEIISKVESELLASTESPFYKVSSKVNALIQENLQKSSSFSSKESSTISKRVQQRFETHQSIIDDGSQKFHAVACYKPRNSDVYLHYVDYLFAEYRTTFFGLRKKKRNLPRPENNNHINRIKVNQPLFTLKYWELLPKSSLIYSDSQYKAEERKIKNHDKVSLEKLEKKIHLPLPKRLERPTLYTLSNIAFPYRWIDRKGDWTIDELRKIELDEAEGSAWWFQYGPRKNTM